MKRQLAAILALDVSGYSRLLGLDELGTFSAWKARRAEIIDPKIASYQGKIENVAGDGMLVVFDSVVNALICAIDIQKTLSSHNSDIDSDRRIILRIGVNVGDITVEEGVVFGDAVNVAFRLEALAQPGEIFVSGSAKEHVEKKLNISFDFLGKKELKNIENAVSVYRVIIETFSSSSIDKFKAICFGHLVNDGQVLTDSSSSVGKSANARSDAIGSFRGFLETYRRSITGALIGIIAAVVSAGLVLWARLPPDHLTDPRGLSASPQPSIAVLPFDNLGGGLAEETFSDGMTHDIITDLSKFSGLLVIAANSTFRYKGTPVDPQDIGEELGVRYILEGSVQRSSDQLRVNAQLIETATARHVWADRFNRSATDTFAVQSEIAQKIVEVIGPVGRGQGKLRKAELARLAKIPTSSLQAYDHYLRGIVAQERSTEESNRVARRAFREAIALDPDYAKAIAGIAWTYHSEYYAGWAEDFDLALSKAEAFAEQAVTIDPTEADTHFALGAVRLAQRRHDEALAALQKAVDLNPNAVDPLMWLGWAYVFSGEAQRGLETMNRAIVRNPYHPGWYYFDLAWAHFMLNEYEEAAAALELRTSKSSQTRLMLAVLYAELDRDNEAARELAAFRQLEPHYTVQTAMRTRPFKHEKDRRRYVDALRALGLPESTKELDGTETR